MYCAWNVYRKKVQKAEHHTVYVYTMYGLLVVHAALLKPDTASKLFKCCSNKLYSIDKWNRLCVVISVEYAYFLAETASDTDFMGSEPAVDFPLSTIKKLH